MSKVLPKGKFIVLEGLDRSGKSSLAKSIQHHLTSQMPTLLMAFPDRNTAIGKMINDFLGLKVQMSNEAIHLLFSANRWQNMKKVKDNLEDGVTIICDRYWYSGVAYSLAKGMDYNWCVNAEKGLIQPDLVIYLRADPELLSKRQAYGEERFQKLDFQRKVKEGFQKLLLGVDKENNKVKVIQIGDKKLEQVDKQVRTIIDQLMNTGNKME